ncbi:5'-methylthioadenosine/S-adenosylhomocysteine nucleosidase [Horticoccus sp. 23ND18S-11]|uniref:5'-methylthioadenosine/S-adenosylhomocysteine nucleosidase n=1 Tax=Horticoccus sp. 23ND18S-11 TaxID=3391832 RepID=UPI0039C94BF2
MVPPPLRHQPPVIVPGLPVARPRRPRPARDLTLVLGAIPQETELVAWALARKSRREFAGFPFIEGRIDGRRVIVAVTGIGKTNATLITTLFVEKFRPREVLMCGTASRIDAAIRNGDVIVGEVTCNHDMGSLGAGYAMEYFGSEGPRGDHSPIVYPGDRRLLAAARRALRTHIPETATHQSPAYVPTVRCGRITSGDQFGITAERIADILRQLQPNLMEMESGSVAQVCYYLRVPFLCIRSGSNRTQHSPDNDYRALSPFAARQAALFTVSLVRELARHPARAGAARQP